MEQSKISKIKNLAKIVRKTFEEIEKNEGWEHGGLGGYCGRATLLLFLLCKKEGIKIKIVEGIGHAFNEFNGHIVDVTATQFGRYPKIHIRKYKSEKKPEFYQKVRTHLSTKSLANSFWIPQHQIDNDKKAVLKYFPDKIRGQRRKKDVKAKRKPEENRKAGSSRN